MAGRLVSMPLTERELEIRNQSIEHDKLRLEKANKAHVAAIIATKKLFSKMTEEQQYEAIEWAFNIKILFK